MRANLLSFLRESALGTSRFRLEQLIFKKTSGRRALCYVAIMKQAVFIERDGVLNQVRVERQHQVSPLTLEEFHPVQKAVAEIKRLKAGGLMVIATTNQPGLS